MIIFDGVALDEIPSIKVEDIRVSPIDYGPVTRPRAIQGGSVFVRNRAGTRTISVTFALLDDNRNSRQMSLMRISEFAKTDREYKLVVPYYPDRHLMAVCTGKPEPSMRQWWESKLRLVFTCFDDPYWISNTEKSASCGNNFFVQGDAPPLMRIERTLDSSASDQAYALDGKTITFSTIPSGNLVIDLNSQTAAVGATSIMQYYNVNSQFLIPRTGTLNITGTGTIKYRERWQ